MGVQGRYIDCGKPHVSSGIGGFFGNFNVVHKLQRLTTMRVMNMAEQLIRSLIDILHHVNKDKGFNLWRDFNISVSAYQMVTHRALGFLPFVLFYVVIQSHHMKSCSPGMRWRNTTIPLVLK